MTGDSAVGSDSAAGSDLAAGNDTTIGKDSGTAADAAAIADVGAVADVAPDAVKPADTAISPDTAAADTAPASPCGLPQPDNTTCEGTLWVCKAGFFHGYGGGACLPATCDNLSKAKNDAIDAVVAKAKVCGSSDACVHVATSTDCGGTCGAAVAGGMESDVQKIVGWVDDNLCKKFEFKTKCGYATPKCMAPKPTCSSGSCWYNGTVP